MKTSEAVSSSRFKANKRFWVNFEQISYIIKSTHESIYLHYLNSAVDL